MTFNAEFTGESINANGDHFPRAHDWTARSALAWSGLPGNVTPFSVGVARSASSEFRVMP